MERPMVAPEEASKVPTNTRQVALNRITDECLQLYDKSEDAFSRVRRFLPAGHFVKGQYWPFPISINKHLNAPVYHIFGMRKWPKTAENGRWFKKTLTFFLLSFLTFNFFNF